MESASLNEVARHRSTPMPFPGGISVSRLTVYDTPTSDGSHGGTPHVHLACSEGYFVMGGEGTVQTLTVRGHQETPLAPGSILWFDPGTIHRLTNRGRLRVLTLMSNSGLPEAGDAVMTFPPQYLTDRETYLRHATLSGDEATRARMAMKRRDLALAGYAELVEQYAVRGPEALDAFFKAAVVLVREQIPAWRQTWEEGPKRAVDRTAEALDALERGEAPHLRAAEVASLQTPTHTGQWGMCGRLDLYHLDGAG